MPLPVRRCEDTAGEKLRNNLGELPVLRNEDDAGEDAAVSAPAWCLEKMERPCTVTVDLGCRNVEWWKTLPLSLVLCGGL